MLKRREFLLSAGTALSAPAWSASSTQAGGVKPSQPIRAAVVGLGGRGRDHMRVMANTSGVEVIAFCDPDQNQLADKAAEFEKLTGRRPRLESDIRKLLEDRSIDVVTIATCNHWHALATIWACQAGKHVYVEKPVAHDFFEGSRMVAAARKYDRLVQGGTQSRSNSNLRKAIQGLRDGVIGELYMARCIVLKQRDSLGFASPEAPPTSLNWDLWLGPAASQPFHKNLVHYNWHWFWDFGNGELGNNGIHYLDVARWGLNKGLPVRVYSTGGRFGYEDQGQTPNTQVASYEFEDGTQLICEIRGRYSNEEGGNRNTVIFYGSEGYMVVGWNSVQVFRGNSSKPEPNFNTRENGDFYNAMDLAHFRNFFDAVQNGRRDMLNAEIEETYRSTVLSLIGNISYRLHRELRFDPQQGRFLGDTEANQMLLGTYRPPFVVPQQV